MDAQDLKERILSLRELAKTARQSDLDSIYVVLDMKPQPGTIGEQLDAVSKYLTMQQHLREDGCAEQKRGETENV